MESVNNDYYNELKILRDDIDSLEKTKHIELFKLIKQNNIQYSSNKNGIFLNLSFVEKPFIEELKKFVYLIKEQDKYINKIEDEKNEMKDKYFTNEKV